MAHIVEVKADSLQRELRTAVVKLAVSVLIPLLLLMIIFTAEEFSVFFIPLLLVVVGIANLVVPKCYQQYKVIKAGMKGEDDVLRVMASLDDDYIVIPSLTLPVNDKVTEIDTVLIGKSKVFVIEVKNVSGELSGRMDSHEWQQTKTSRNGVEREKKMYNPVKQNKKHVYACGNILKQSEISVYLNSLVVISDTARLNISGNDGSVVNLSKFKKYLSDNDTGKPLADDFKKQLVRVLKSNHVNKQVKNNETAKFKVYDAS